MRHFVHLYLIILLLLCSCGESRRHDGSHGEPARLSYASNLTMEKYRHYTVAKLKDPWKSGRTLHTYILIPRADSALVTIHPEGTVVYTPVKRAVVFTTAHANLMEMLHAQNAIVGVADAKYMLIDDVQHRLNMRTPSVEGVNPIVDCGNSMKPDVEKIIDMKADAVFLSPFENSGGYGQLDKTDIPVIECADYMETGALARAEWMRFYGRLLGKEREADSLFAVVEANYLRLKRMTEQSKQTRSVLPDRKTGSVWYMPGGKSSIGLLYKDAGGNYAFAGDGHSGSLALPFETVLDKAGKADFWILGFNGAMTRSKLLAEYEGYRALKPFRTGEIYGCQVDSVPYFEEVSWRPDWLLQDFIQLFHPDLDMGGLRYYHKLEE